MRRTTAIFLLILHLAAASSGVLAAPSDANLLDEDFTSYAAGLFSSEVGAHAEYHYLPETAPKGPWSVASFHSGSDSQRAWKVMRVDGQRVMAQTFRNKLKHTHPMLSAGDPLWQDYQVEVHFAPNETKGRSGFAFRYHNCRCYYFFGVDGPKAQLLLVRNGTGFQEPYEKVLAEAPCSWQPGNYLVARVRIEGSRVRTEIDHGPVFEIEDATYPQGGIAILSDIPTLFQHVSVHTTTQAKARLDQAIRQREADERRLQSENPKPVVWRRFSTPEFGAGRNVRFGDLDGDGQIDMLIGQVVNHGPKDRNSELSCLTAIRFDGKKLWQIGQPDPWKTMLSCDVGFQIHDLDGDGANEVVYTMGQEILVADGKTGKVKYKSPTPKMPANTKAPYNSTPRILGDSLFFCDVRGTGRAADLVIKDRYQSFWVLDDHLRPLWHAQCNTGHYPYACDIDHDGKDEIFMGYSLFDHDGKLLWSLDDRLKDHDDGAAIVPFRPDAGQEPRIFCSASDEGTVILDLKGGILKHHYLGHVQNPGIADFRPDLPGSEAVTVNYWGNQGIIHFYDAEGNVYHDFEPFHHGSLCLPINWTGKPGAYVVLSANPADGGLFDGWGRRVVRFPEDGHPDMCYAVVDVTGDAREEIVVWDPSETWVYTQDDNPRTGDVLRLQRNPLDNDSNYRAVVATPAPSAKAENRSH